MSPNRNTKDLRTLSLEGNPRYSYILSLIEALYQEGDYLLTERPSEIESGYFIQLEGEVNDLHRELYREYKADDSYLNKAALIAVLQDIEVKMLAPVSEWADYAKYNPDGPRPQSLFAKNKSIGRLLVDLINRL